MATVLSVPKNPAVRNHVFLTPSRNFPTTYVRMSHLGSYLLYFSYVFVLRHTAVFIMETSVYMTLCTPLYLVKIYGHVPLCTPIFSLETSVHALPQASGHVLLQASLLILPCVCLSMHVLTRASVTACT